MMDSATLEYAQKVMRGESPEVAFKRVNMFGWDLGVFVFDKETGVRYVYNETFDSQELDSSGDEITLEARAEDVCIEVVCEIDKDRNEFKVRDSIKTILAEGRYTGRVPILELHPWCIELHQGVVKVPMDKVTGEINGTQFNMALESLNYSSGFLSSWISYDGKLLVQFTEKSGKLSLDTTLYFRVTIGKDEAYITWSLKELEGVYAYIDTIWEEN